MHELYSLYFLKSTSDSGESRRAHRKLRLRVKDTAARDCYARGVADAGQDGGGLLGDLPSHRPSVRTPRREAAAARAEKAATASPGSASRPARERQSRPAGTTTPNAPEQRPSGAEQLARAGAGLALAPARIGLRLAGRAVDGLGKAVGRN